MAILLTNFSEGDIFTGGTVASTSSVNGINTTINSNTITKLIHVGSDLTEGSVSSSVAETTIGSVTVPAGTVSDGCFIIASLKGSPHAGQTNTATFRLKTGVSSSEAERESFFIATGSAVQSGGAIVWYDTAATYANEVSIIITGQNNDNNADSKTTCHSIVVYGI